MFLIYICICKFFTVFKIHDCVIAISCFNCRSTYIFPFTMDFSKIFPEFMFLVSGLLKFRKIAEVYHMHI